MNQYGIACKYGNFVVMRKGEYDSVAYAVFTEYSVDACLKWIEQDSGVPALIPVMLAPE